VSCGKSTFYGLWKAGGEGGEGGGTWRAICRSAEHGKSHGAVCACISKNRYEDWLLLGQMATWKAAEPEGATTLVRVVRLFYLIPAVKWFLAIAVGRGGGDKHGPVGLAGVS
jgi:hypothetical protein